jgi:hypothetical protein
MSGPGLNVPLDDPRLPALRLVRPPAFLLLCVGLLNIGLCLVVLAAMLFDIQVLPTTPEAAAAQQEAATWPVLLTALGAIVSGALTVWGALSAFSLRNWGLVVVGAVTAVFPLTPTCCLGLPFAAWMLWVLNMPEVKKYFA